MRLRDYILLGIILALFVIVIIYLVRNRGCSLKECQHCNRNCKRRK